MPAQSRSAVGLFFFSLASIPFLIARPRLLALAAIPIIINLFVFIAIIFATNYFLTVPVVTGMDPSMGVVARYIDAFLQILVSGSIIVGSVIIAAFVSFILIIPIGAPFCDAICGRIENELLAGRAEIVPSAPFWPSIRHALLDAVRRLLFFLPVYIALFLLGWVPVVGTIAAAALGFFCNGLFLAMDGFSYSMDRRFMKFPEKRRFFRENRRLWFPFGLGLATLALLTCILFVLPILSCVGATRLYCEKILDE